MAPTNLIAIDAGSYGARCLLLDTVSNRISSRYRRWNYKIAPGTGGWGLDLDLDQVWRNVTSVCREVLQHHQISPESIAGIAVTGMRFSMVVLDDQGEPLLAVPNRDARAVAEAFELAEGRGPALLERTGCWPTPISLAARLLWMQREHPDSLARAATVFSLGDWITLRLSDETRSDPTQASGSLLIDLDVRDWAWDLIGELALPKEIFPQLLSPGDLLGSLTPAAAEALGLPVGIPIGMGGGDTQIGLLGVGAIEAGEVAAIAGSTTPIQWVSNQPVVDLEGRLWTGHHALPDRWVVESNIGGTGEALEWFALLLFPNTPDPLVRFMIEAESTPAGSGGILSTMGGQLFNARDMSFPIETLSFSHFIEGTPEDRKALFARAGLESMAFGTRQNFEQLQSAIGGELSRLLIGGGQTRSHFFTQLLSDTLGRELEVGPVYASGMGAALCAGVAAGLYPDFKSGLQKLNPILRNHDPDVALRDIFSERYTNWKKHQAAALTADQIAASSILEEKSKHPGSAPAKFPPLRRKARILVTAEMDGASLRDLETRAEVVYSPYREDLRVLTDEDLVAACQGFDIFITEIDLVDAQALRQLPQLQAVISCRGNPTNIDQEACSLYGIPLLHTPGRNADAVADLALAFMIMLGRKLAPALRFHLEPGGEPGDLGRRGQAHAVFQGSELAGKTVGLVGLGRIGTKVARRASAFDARVLAYDPAVSPVTAGRDGAALVPLDVLLEESDFISLHLPLTPETRGMFDHGLFQRMKPGGFFINTARGALVNEEALTEALRTGHLAGAALDVFEVEPPGSDHPLLAFDQVISTPHIGGNTFQVGAHQGAIIVEELSRLMDGYAPKYIRNPQVLETFRWGAVRPEPEPDELKDLMDRPAPQVSDSLEDPASAFETSPTPSNVVADQAGNPLVKGLKKLMGAKPDAAHVPTVDLQSIRTRMETILKAFMEKVNMDQGLREFAENRQVAMHYHLKDLDLHFYTVFNQGEVQGGVGLPEQEMDVTLRMKADLLDGMFTGRTNPTRAAMTGKLSFSGDTKKALSLQKVQNQLMGLYQAARDAVGDPGDLSAIPEETPTAAPAARPAAPQPPPGPAKLSAVGDVRDEIVDALDELFSARLITSTGGNISARTASNDSLWITPSQLFKGSLNPSMLVEIDLDGKPIDPNATNPSSERMLHCAILKRRPELQVVIHTHAPKATSLALAELPFLPISTEAAFVGEISRVPFIMPGTVELAEAAAEALGEDVAVLLQNHGLVVAAGGMRRAIDLTLIIEQSAEKILYCYALGKEPPVLPAEVVAELKSIGRMMV